MADRLWNILNFTGIAIGDTASLPHLLNLSGVPVKPDRVDLQFPAGFVVDETLTTTTVVVIRNVSDGVGACQAWVMAIHPAIRLLGGAPDDGNMAQSMVPRPWSTGGASPPTPFPPAPVVLTIYARSTGSDTTGTGTLANPYRTAQRAFEDLRALNPVLPGYRVVVDVTGSSSIATPEAFPAYQFPAIQGPAQLETFGDPATVPFLASEAVTVLATPTAATNIPLADTTIVAADIVSIVDVAATGMATITISAPRASWAANALKNKFLVGAGTDASTSCAIFASDSTHLFIDNTAAAVTSIPQQTLHVVEPGAAFAAAGVGADGAGFECVGCNSIAFQGIRFTAAGGPALLIANCPQPFFELCDIAGLGAFQITQQLALFSSVVRDLLDMEGVSFFTRRSNLFQVSSMFFLSGGAQVFRQTSIDQCAALGPTDFSVTGAAVGPTSWQFFDCRFSGATANAVDAVGGGNWSFGTVQIANSAGDAIHASGLTTGVLTNVTGTGNGGFGVHLEDGAAFRVTDNATLVTGTGGDTKVGTLPVRTWTNFRTLIPTKNQYDLQTPFIVNVASGLATPGGDDVTGAGSGGCSGSRLFQRP